MRELVSVLGGLLTCFVFIEPVTAQYSGTHVLYQDIFIPASSSVHVGIDSGSGFVVSVLTDDDADGMISLPTVYDGYRVAIGFPDTAPEDCLIYTTIGTQVGQTLELPFFSRVGGGPVGAELSELTGPTTMLTPNQIVPILDGSFPGWPAVRVVDMTGISSFPDFLERVGGQPGYTGDVQTTASFIRIRVVPEPSTLALAALGALGLLIVARRKR